MRYSESYYIEVYGRMGQGSTYWRGVTLGKGRESRWLSVRVDDLTYIV